MRGAWPPVEPPWQTLKALQPQLALHGLALQRCPCRLSRALNMVTIIRAAQELT